MNEDSYKLLGICAEAVEKDHLLVQDSTLKEQLKTCFDVAEHLQHEINLCLDQGDCPQTDPLEEGTDAEILTRRCYDSIVKMSKALARYPQADESAKTAVRKLIAAKEQMVYHLRPYL